ncbi:hypothetical protein ABW21_db0200966 [Orbilia brochopaga]|nr:hypothetical protein ABW21_db0200966 [Drechslerella brochopaga]
MLLRRRGVRLIPPTCRIINSPSRSLLVPLTSSRSISTQRRPSSTFTAADSDNIPPASYTTPSPSPPRPTPLATLPTGYLLRTIFICTISTSPVLSNLLTRTLLAYTRFLTSNPLTRFLIQHTFYDHFCAGTTHPEIQTTLGRLKSWGFRGIILAYAKEVEVEASEASAITSSSVDEQSTAADIAAWRDGNIRTIEYSEPGSFIAIKYSGAGASSVLAMEHRVPPPPPPSPAFFAALDDICVAAQARGNVRLLFDAEQTRYQDAMDGYTLALMRKYNARDKPPTVYNTYQMYRRASPGNLIKHLNTAKREGFAFGAKVVRGAYLHSDPRQTFWLTKEETDAAYDAGIATLLTFHNADTTTTTSTSTDGVNIGMVVATHNQESVDAAMTLLRQLKASGGHTLQRKDITFAQLAGMADEVSMSVINGDASAGEPVNVVKYIPWGTMEECVKYLLRRADENKDSLKRTGSTRRAAWDELWRRVFGRA